MHLVDATHHQAESRADIARTAALKTMGKMREAERRVKLGPNVEFSGVPAGHLSNHPAGGTSAGTQG